MAMLEINSLTKAFGGLRAVNNVSFEVEKGQIVSLIGPNGAGKTTIFSMISGLVQPTSGAVRFQGENITGMQSYKVADRGLVTTFQKTKIFPTLSVEDAIMVGTHCRNNTSPVDILLRTPCFYSERKKCIDRVEEVLEYTKLTEKRHYMCTGLSYGEQRILEIAVAMGACPDMLLLDEPAAGLNHSESDVLMGMIYGLRDAGMTILLIEHDMQLVMRISDRVVVLNFGELIAAGTPEEVTKNETVIEAYLGSGGDA